jgi:Tol biopolymer transport system component/DNA-binding winged helix-turn-helix (wHTH) protein
MEADRTPSPPPIRFGVFELNTATGELRKQGFRIRLNGQPIEILRLLLEKSGAVVTRQELKTRLWPHGVHVDFDRSVNKAFVKLREALGDDAASPRFIETLPRVGYRFIAPIDVPTRDAEGPEPAVAPPKRRRMWRRTGVLAGVIAAAVTTALILRSRTFSPEIVHTVQMTHSIGSKWGPLLASRSTVFFTEWNGSRLRVMQVPVSGGDSAPVPMPFEKSTAFDLSPNGARLLVGEVPPNSIDAHGMALWTIPVAGGSPRRVGDIHTDSAAWSSDARIIYFTDGSHLETVLPDGTGRKEILRAPGQIWYLRVSPDGRTLRFTVSRRDKDDLWEADSDGANLRRVFPDSRGPACQSCGDWIRGGRGFLFTACGGGRQDLWLAWGRRAPEPLSRGPMNLLYPVGAPGGSRIFAVGEVPQGELTRYDRAAGRFEPFLGGVSAEGIAFSPDGKWAAYTSYPEGILYRSRIDGTEKLQLTFPPFRAMLPTWSPDGRWIAFARMAPSIESSMFRVSPDGGPPEAVAPGEPGYAPSWSPDGKSLAFGGGPGQAGGIRILDIASRKITLLPESSGNCCPAWSPDGRFLFAEATDPRRLVRYDFAAGSWKELFRGPFVRFALSHDGGFVYLDGGCTFLSQFRLSDGSVERLVNLRGFRRALSWAGPWFSLAPDDSPLLLRDTTSDQIYALDWTR